MKRTPTSAATLLLSLTVSVAAALLPKSTAWAAPITESGAETELFAKPDRLPEIDRAVASFRQQQFDACLRHLEAAVAKQPSLAPPLVTLARLHLSANQLPQGRAALERAALKHPDNPELYLVFAKLALQENRLTAAAAHYDKVLSLPAPSSWSPEQKNKLQHQCHDGLAAVAERRDDWKSATQWLETLLTKDPKNGPARQRLARAMFLSDRAQDAYHQLQQAKTDNETLAVAPVTLAGFYAGKGETEQAKKWYDQAVKQYPKDANTYLAYANWLLGQNQTDEAQRNVDAAMKLGEASRQLKLVAGTIALQRRDYGKAEELFNSLFAENPADAEAVSQLAIALIEQPDKDKKNRAVQLAEINARQYSRSAAALSTLGWVYYRVGRAEDAERALRTAMSGKQASSDTVYFLARVMDSRGQDKDETKKLLDAALNAPGRFVFRKEAQDWLKTLK